MVAANYSISVFKMGELENAGDEDHIVRHINLLELCRSKGYRGVGELKAHGWDDKIRLQYNLAMEREGFTLEEIKKDEEQGLRVRGSTKLLASRAIATILETVEQLHCFHHLSVTSLGPNEIRVRRDHFTGYLIIIDAVSSGFKPGCVYSEDFYPKTGESVAVGDSFIAGLITWLSFLHPFVYRKEMNQKNNKEVDGEYTSPFKFLRNIVCSGHWHSSEFPKIRSIMQKHLNSPESELLTSDWRSTILGLLKQASSSMFPDYDSQLVDAYPDSTEITTYLEEMAAYHFPNDTEEEQVDSPKKPLKNIAGTKKQNEATRGIKKKKQTKRNKKVVRKSKM